MKTSRSHLAPAFATGSLIALLAACGPAPEKASEPAAPTAAAPAPAPAPAPTPAPAATPTKVIGLEGLGDLKIGEPAPVGGTWAERGAQTGAACRTVSSPDYPGVYAIVTDGKVQRITVGQRSDVKLVEGVGVGSPEKDVKAWFGGFREEPHKYQPAPAKYLTAPNAASGDPAVRFEIGADGKVSLIHVGLMPVLGYVEGCS
jgi:pyruvate/2-oxoglutarate dehydrogenase complex dihydrolipoamide acyltransferase (E2) component